MTELDMLPTTRAEWQRAFPAYQTRYLAWCNAKRRFPSAYDGPDFMRWISMRSIQFRTLKGLQGYYVSLDFSDEFTDYLWGEL